jgi:hypothetical protein
MTESLVVDPARLKKAGSAVRDQKLPSSPPPISASGTDSVSAAINETMPVIEAPVSSGLSEVQRALANTGSKVVTAAEMYAETDQLLGEHVGTVQFRAAGREPADAAAATLLGSQSTDKKPDDTPGKGADKKPSPGAAPNLNQLSAMTQAVQPLSQGLQSVMSSAQQAGGMGSTATSPAKLAEDTKKDDTRKDETSSEEPQLVDDTTPAAAGAAAGAPGSGNAPVQSTAGGPAHSSASGIGL